MPHAKLKKPKPEVEAGRPWWEVEGFDDLTENEKKCFRIEAEEIAGFNEEQLSEVVDESERTVERSKTNAKRVVNQYRFIRRFYAAVRERLRSAPTGDGHSAAGEIAAGPGHRPDSAA